MIDQNLFFRVIICSPAIFIITDGYPAGRCGKVMEMFPFPVKQDLYHFVQIGKIYFLRYHHSAPYRRMCIFQHNLQYISSHNFPSYFYMHSIFSVYIIMHPNDNLYSFPACLLEIRKNITVPLWFPSLTYCVFSGQDSTRQQQRKSP